MMVCATTHYTVETDSCKRTFAGLVLLARPFERVWSTVGSEPFVELRSLPRLPSFAQDGYISCP
jgi:hypothetical protein